MSDVLYHAAARGDEPMVKSLVDGGAAPDGFIAKDGKTALMVAAAGGYKSLVNMLLTAKTNRASPSLQDKLGYTALHHSASNGHASICLVLLFYGALAETKDSAGNTPIDVARSHGHLELIQAVTRRMPEIRLPFPPDSPTLVRQGPNELVIQWDVSSAEDGSAGKMTSVSGYQVQIAQLPSKSWRDVGHLKTSMDSSNDDVDGRKVGASKRKVRVARLKPGSGYVTRVRAQNRYGWGDWSSDSTEMQTDSIKSDQNTLHKEGGSSSMSAGASKPPGLFWGKPEAGASSGSGSNDAPSRKASRKFGRVSPLGSSRTGTVLDGFDPSEMSSASGGGWLGGTGSPRGATAAANQAGIATRGTVKEDTYRLSKHDQSPDDDETDDVPSLASSQELPSPVPGRAGVLGQVLHGSRHSREPSHESSGGFPMKDFPIGPSKPGQMGQGGTPSIGQAKESASEALRVNPMERELRSALDASRRSLRNERIMRHELEKQLANSEHRAREGQKNMHSTIPARVDGKADLGTTCAMCEGTSKFRLHTRSELRAMSLGELAGVQRRLESSLDVVREVREARLLLDKKQGLRACMVCKTRPRCVVMLPCKHLVACRTCTDRLVADAALAPDPETSADPFLGGFACPMCRSVVDSVVDVFF